MNNYILLILLWSIYFSVHSILASEKIKQQLLVFGRFYRIFYNLIAIGGLIMIMVFVALIPSIKFFEPNNLTKFLSLVPATYGILVIKAAFKMYSLKEFMGIRQMKDNTNQEEFKKDGILKFVRHPLYSGSILILFGFIIFSPSYGNIISFICILIYLFIGIGLEEKKLIKAFGEDYVQYKKEVPMLLPKLRFGRK